MTKPTRVTVGQALNDCDVIVKQSTGVDLVRELTKSRIVTFGMVATVVLIPASAAWGHIIGSDIPLSATLGFFSGSWGMVLFHYFGHKKKEDGKSV